jgi:hypothetical protein
MELWKCINENERQIDDIKLEKIKKYYEAALTFSENGQYCGSQHLLVDPNKQFG